jgi:predicted phosphodiesterase
MEAWKPDLVVVDGDIVNRGPRSADCLRLVTEKQKGDNWHVIRGNHEDYVIACSLPGSPQSGPEADLWRFAHWSYQQLEEDVTELLAMPDQFSLQLENGDEFRVVHASMRNNRDGIYRNSADSDLEEQIAPPPKVFVTAHTHRPLVRSLNDTLVVNVGAVGAPFDYDKRASYGRFVHGAAGWSADIARVEYDRDRTERDYVDSGFLEGAGPLAQLMLVELRRARGLIFRWADRYQDAVLAGAICMEESVRELLAADDVYPYTGPPGWSI